MLSDTSGGIWFQRSLELREIALGIQTGAT